MLSNVDIERLITAKRNQIENEKCALGITQPPDRPKLSSEVLQVEDVHDDIAPERKKKHVTIAAPVAGGRQKDDPVESQEESDDKSYRLRDHIPAGLDRFIRRRLGLAAMLRAGEYSPNGPLARAEPAPRGDALGPLGEYERRRNALRRLHQQQYREYLDLQAKKKQEAKEQAERERLEREEKERQREEELEKQRVRRLEKESPQRRASVCYMPADGAKNGFRNRVDTGVQASVSPLSVAVQTDEAELYRLSTPCPLQRLVEAERELSPRTVAADWSVLPQSHQNQTHQSNPIPHRRMSYGEIDERPAAAARTKLLSSLRHTYLPSILDSDAIMLRNEQAEKEAVVRRQFYQQELKNQILEQQRIREERKTREKMLEQAEMRRLEEQLRMLRAAQDNETRRQRGIHTQMKENATDYEKKRTALQKEIYDEEKSLFRAKTQPHSIASRNTKTDPARYQPSYSDIYPRKTTSNPNKDYRTEKLSKENRLPFSTNIPDNSIFSPNYDVDSYLRKNLNPSKESLMSNRIESVSSNGRLDIDKGERKHGCERVVEALVHDRPKDRLEKPKYEPSFLRKDLPDILNDETPIPVLRHSPKTQTIEEDTEIVSEGMKLVEDKWKVPAVQKNILKTLPNNEGKNVSILTQLGSIRRQLQLEQLKLDNMVAKSDD